MRYATWPFVAGPPVRPGTGSGWTSSGDIIIRRGIFVFFGGVDPVDE
jgi:hypothetical protein